ncbi:hypothetical protein QAD02_002976 [Eretmocerus hayati]|uniref:Uncharacterized protein n=1 Tax=Eretmocerus hayati TaxID=131215 RepID=A0ACC2NKU1_9HYME|nr:hypothetical protein QAD02_002976 [Eretmocerus hayati]
MGIERTPARKSRTIDRGDKNGSVMNAGGHQKNETAGNQSQTSENADATQPSRNLIDDDGFVQPNPPQEAASGGAMPKTVGRPRENKEKQAGDRASTRVTRSNMRNFPSGIRAAMNCISITDQQTRACENITVSNR